MNYSSLITMITAGFILTAGITDMKAKPAAKQTVANTKLGSLDNLAHVADKVRKNEKIVIGYIGGSITQGAGASRYGNNYYWKSKTNLEREIAKRGAKAVTSTAAIGGTGSNYACFRAGRQLLHKKPDLLIIEFAVNDNKNPSADESLECLVRQALKVNPNMGIVLFYTSTAALDKSHYAKGLLPRSVTLHHRVAKHYGLAEVMAGPSVHKGIKEGRYTAKQFFPDGVHPADIGHALYAETLTKALLPLFGLPSPTSTPDLPPLLGKGTLEYARLDPVAPQNGNSNWSKRKKTWYGVPVLRCTAPGKPLTFKAKGNNISLQYMGKIKLTWQANGQNYKKILTSHSPKMPMPSCFHFPKNSNPDGQTITVEVVDNGKKSNGELWGVFSIQPATN